MTSTFDNNSIKDDLSVEEYILKLVKISLIRKATKIAVRFDPKKHKIQIVDNSVGFNKYELSNIFTKEKIFDKICSVSNVIIVTSKIESSPHTYVKIVSTNGSCRFFEGYSRPCKGTTVTAYEFKPDSWKNSENNKNHSISYVIAAVALTELKVSFSLRNDDEERMLLQVARPHNPWDVLKYLSYKHTNCQVTKKKSSDSIIQKDKVSYETKEEQASQKSCISASFFKKSTENDSCYVNKAEKTQESFVFASFLDKSTDDENCTGYSDMACSPISGWSSWSYKPQDIGTRANADDHNYSLFSSLNQNDNFINLSQMSIWSDWVYQSNNHGYSDQDKRELFQRLPISNCKKIPIMHRNANHLSRDVRFNVPSNSESNDVDESFLSYSMENIRFYLGRIKFRRECRLSKDTLSSLEILRQVNNEFIVAVINESGKKMLILIDQHAVHERIRYEWLIDSYRDCSNYKFFVAKLREDLLITDMDSESIKILANYRKLLMNIGIHIKSIVDSTSCIIDGVPKCFLKTVKTYNYDFNIYRLKRNVRELLLEIANGIAVSNCTILPILPTTINNVIASEACHGAIKFGDPLNIKECTILIKALQDTKAPTRCAHGRPSMIPVMDLSDFENRKPPAKVRSVE